jgi:hypothetical protein
LPYVEGAAYDSRAREHKRQCLPGTRVGVIDTIMSWCEKNGGERIFWLCGMAGTGEFKLHIFEIRKIKLIGFSLSSTDNLIIASTTRGERHTAVIWSSVLIGTAITLASA